MTLFDAPQRTRVLVITTDVLGARIAGPAIRAWEISKSLNEIADVRLASTESAELAGADFPVLVADDFSLRAQVDWADVVVFSGGVLSMFPWIRESDVILVADVYDPFHLEALELTKSLEPSARDEEVAAYAAALNVQLERADFILCASEKQRDFWLGHLGAIGRLNQLTYDADNTLRSLIDVVPFGVSDQSSQPSRGAIKGVVPGIGAADKVILWGGGIYNWFDPLTLVRAIEILAARRTNVKLYFLGTAHPNPNVPEMRMAAETRDLSDGLGLTNQHIFFNESWVEYEDRINYLKDADVGVSTHFMHVETVFSFRTRILDYLWAGLPIVATDGDTFAPLIKERRLGEVVPAEDAESLALALERVLFTENHDELRARVDACGHEMRWSRVLQPLREFCVKPSHAADFPPGTTASSRGLATTLLRQRVSELERFNRQILSSTSWRITAPLRAIRRRKLPREEP